MLVPRWLRIALFATAIVNLVAAVGFLPEVAAVRRLAHLPVDAPPIYLRTIAVFVLLFGTGYLWTAVTGLTDRLFVALAAAGKLSFVGVTAWCVRDGSLPPAALIAVSPDLGFGLAFTAWLWTTRAAPWPHFARVPGAR
ncbi:MAG: hypothetical protein KIT14_12285 [bacterium]|nr:hypothetical protein [bacterium]